MRISIGRFASLLTLSVVTLGSGRVFAQADGIEFFESRIRPVLATHCIACHGPKAQKGGLRLDSREALLRGGESGPVIVEGDPESSLLVDAVAYDAEPKMPPKAKLPADVLDDLKGWVKQGAPWPEASPTTQEQEKAPSARSWAFRALTNPSYPIVSDPKWSKTSVDWFVLKKLDEVGLKPSKPADRRTLIRRWSYTLTGLPPSPEEVRAFEQDASPDASRKVVDRLLASPHYGERWGRHWLDVARYADTKGYVFFEDKDYPWAYTYRDYVVRSLNEDKPYDRFVVEQIAADQLPVGDDKRALAALGFLTVGGRFMNNDHDILDDRIDVDDPRPDGADRQLRSPDACHDHKFDPIPTADYYALYGVFASSVEPSVPPLLGPPPETEEYRKFERELKRREENLEAFVRSTYERLIDGSKRRAGEYLLAAHAAKDKPKTDEFMLIADGHDLNPAMIARWRAVLDRSRRPHDPAFAPWHALAALAQVDFPEKSGAILDEMARRGDKAKRINPVLLRALIEARPRSLSEVSEIYERVLNRAEGIWVDASSRARLEKRKPGALPDESYEALSRVFHGPDAPPNLPRSAIDNLTLFPDRPSQAQFQKLGGAVDTWRATGAGAPPRAMALVDLPHPIEPKVFVRGNPNTPGPAVPRRFLSSLPEAGSARRSREGSGRLELARSAIVDPEKRIPSRRGSSSIASGCSTSGRPWSTPPATSARGATRPRIPNCSTTSPPPS